MARTAVVFEHGLKMWMYGLAWACVEVGSPLIRKLGSTFALGALIFSVVLIPLQLLPKGYSKERWSGEDKPVSIACVLVMSVNAVIAWTDHGPSRGGQPSRRAARTGGGATHSCSTVP